MITASEIVKDITGEKFVVTNGLQVGRLFLMGDCMEPTLIINRTLFYEIGKR